MEFRHLLEENHAIVARTGKMRSKRSLLPRLFKNWLRNSDGEAECQEKILGNHDQMLDHLDGELSKINRTLTDHVLPERKLFSDLYIVHSLPKVGGMTIAATLTASFKEATVFHLHCLSEAERKRWSMATARFAKQSSRDSLMWHVHNGTRASMMLEAGGLLFPNSQKRVIICGVREPVALALSFFFYSFDFLFERSYDEITVEMASSFVIGMLRNELCHLGPLVRNPENWLLEDFCCSHDFDVFDHDFDTQKGYQIHQRDKCRILIIRQENMDSMQEALSSLLGYPAKLITVVNENIAESKPYSGIYRSIRENLKFDPDFLRSVYASRYCRKFYTETERESFLERWKSPIASR